MQQGAHVRFHCAMESCRVPVFVVPMCLLALDGDFISKSNDDSSDLCDNKENVDCYNFESAARSWIVGEEGRAGDGDVPGCHSPD